MRAALLLLVLPLYANAQLVVEGRVLDASTDQVLPFCNVGVVGAPVGTLTNAEGRFRIAVAGPGAVLRFSYIGYGTIERAAGDVADGGEIRLSVASTVLNTFEVFPDDALLERVLRAARELRDRAAEQARAYFELHTYMDERPVEVLEGFYNAGVRGGRLERLDLKKGRIGIAQHGDRYFVSLNITRALAMLDATERNAHFPISPLSIDGVRKLRKSFSVRMVESGTGDAPVDHLRIEPREGRPGFATDLWLAADDRVVVLELSCADCHPRPLIPWGHMRSIDTLDLHYRVTWDPVARHTVPDHIELAYDLAYTTDSDGTARASTTALLHLFDPGGAFILPIFDHAGDQSDYRKITFQPYDTTFWEQAPTLVRTERQLRDRDFFRRNGLLTGSTAPQQWHAKSFFESNYAWWSPNKRISLKSLPPPPEDPAYPIARPRGAAVPITQVHLVAQIYLDMDSAQGRLTTYTATVFDAFRSFHRLPEETYTDPFINIFFDLCEIERRKLDEQLKAPGISVTQARVLHADAVVSMERTTDRYVKEAKLGADRIALERWNDRVKEELGIDNFALFGLERTH